MSRPPDRILTDAVIWTGVQAARMHPTGALAIRDGRIAAVGSTADVMALRGPDTEVTSLEGRFLLPGFVDAHVHLLAGGLRLSRVELRGMRSPEAFTRTVAARAGRLDPGEWVLGGGWNEHEWGGPLPHRAWLDEAAPEHPVLLHRADLHIAVASTRALELAGIGSDTPDDAPGEIDRDPETGEPTGILRERAILRVMEQVPHAGPGQRARALTAAMDHALSRGVTQLHDMGALQDVDESWASLNALRKLHAEGGVPLRVQAALPLEDQARVAAFTQGEGRGDLRLRWGAVKAFVDGSLGATTAWFTEPYSNDSGNAGGPVCDLDALAHDLQEAVDAGLHPIVHAIGDRANDWLLACYRSIADRHPGADLRLRVEHAQHLTPAGLGAACHPGLLLSVQPAHLVDDGVWMGEVLDEARIRRAYAFASLVSGGARLAFGSDWTVAPLDPLLAVQAAVSRRLRGPDGRLDGAVWNPLERLSLDQALEFHTLGGARAAFMESETGTLELGKLADLTVLSRNPFEVDPHELAEHVEVDMTFVEGEVRYRRGDSALHQDPVMADAL